MKRVKAMLMMILVLGLIIVGKQNIFAYTGIDSQYLFEPSTFDNLVLNYSTLPSVSVSGGSSYTIKDGTCSSGSPSRGVYYSNSGAGQNLNSTITVFFNNCGTLNGRPIDMKLIYSDIVTNKENSYLYWSAFGSHMLSSNEWWYEGVEHVNADIYFYYHGESSPININVAYLSIFSEDENEGAGANQSSQAYIYNVTQMAYASTKQSLVSSRTYYNTYYGTGDGSTEAGSLNCVAFQYKNKDHLNVELYGFGRTSIGYHFQYTPLTATLPSGPVKSVDKTESKLGEKLTYTIEQKISQRYDSAFHYSGLMFSDTIDSNLTYNSLKVYNETGADITASAGSVGYNNSTRKLTYTFNQTYLNNMAYNGQKYKFVIDTTINNSSTSANIQDKAQVTINNSYTMTSNIVNTTLKAKVITHFINKKGVKIADDVETNGNLLDSYTTTPKDIYGYKLESNSGNTSGKMGTNVTEVTYVYDLIRVNISINKTLEATDSTAVQKLKGARFKLTVNNFADKVQLASPAETYLSTYTDENGHCLITGVPYGNYTIVEEVVPNTAFSGIFMLNGSKDRISNFNIDVNKDETLQYSIEDVAKKMQITVYKEDTETGTTTQGDAHLENAEYTLYRDAACTDAVETITIAKNEDGTYSATSGWYLVGTYYVKETKAPEGYLIDEKVYTVAQDPAAQTEEYTKHIVTSKDNVKRNNIDITKYLEKTDSTEKQNLAGAEFTAQLVSKNSPDSNKLYKAVTDAYGNCTIKDLPYGTYRVWESKVPDTAYNGEFYINGAQTRSTSFEQFIELDKTEREAYRYADITDVAKKMQITVYKEDTETGTTTQGDAHLENAEYTLYRDAACTDAVETITIAKNEDGTYSATSGWYLVGTYYVKETKAPEGYLIDEKVYTVAQDPAAQTEEYTKHIVTSKDNVKRNNIDITKYLEKTDSTEKQNLAGAEFTAQLVSKNSPDSNKLYKAVTDAYGNCTIKDLPYGTYRVWESKVPDTAYNGEFYINGAQTRSTSFEQFIELDKTEREAYRYADITDVAKKMQITVYKEDTETGTTTQGDAHLENAEYTLYRDAACTDAVETITIAKNEDGTYSATSGWYLVGTYYVKETKAPEGYLIDEKVYPVEQIPSEQTEEHSTHNILSKDKVMKGIVRVIKYNDNSTSTDKSSAMGAVLRLTLNSNPDKYYEATIDENGYLEFVDEDYRASQYPYTIPYGKYTISEVKASDAGENTFIYNQQTKIEYQEQTQRYIFNDEYVRMKLKIEKYDGETSKKLLTGATFKIWDVNNQRWYEEMIYPSGKFISEFTTNDEGELTINRHLEAGKYILYEIKAPEGYYLDENLREGSQGYEFTIGVEADGKVVFYHGKEREELSYDTENYDNIPVKMYKHTIKINNIAQKATIEVTKIAEQFSKVQGQESEYGQIKTPVYEEKGLEGTSFKLVAAEDIVTPEGTVRYTKGQVVTNITTGKDGIAKTIPVYLGKYTIVEANVPNGYILDETPIEVNIEYTNQYEEVQEIKVTKNNNRQKVELEFEKVYKELEVSKFKFDEKEAIFGIYTKEPVKNYKGESVIGKDELVDVIKTDDENKLRNNVELPEGKYYVKELYVSSPYAKTNDTYEFSVEYKNNKDEKIELTVNNGKVENKASTAELELIVYPDVVYDELEIAKEKDRDTLEKLAELYGIADKTYGVYLDEKCEKAVQTIDGEEARFKTNEDGIIDIPDMPTGTYYLKEIEAPYGYEKSEEVIKAEINEEGKLVLLTAKEPTKKAKILRKYDTFTKDVIEGVEFEITDKEENVVYTGKTNKQGEIEVPIIYFENEEKYYYEEKTAPKMYKADEEKYEFTAKVDEEKCEWKAEKIEVGNDRKTIEEVVIRKTDSKTGEALEGCVFTIALLDDEGKEYVNSQGETIYLVKEGVTNEEGEYVIKNVPYGRYRFIEVKAPEGYEMDEDMTGLEFTVDENSPEKIIFEVTNTGDIAVVALVIVAVVCAAGIVFVVVKNKKKKSK